MKLDHIAIIMDGNRRWASANNLASYEGHKKGAENLWNIINNIHEFKLKFLTLFVFSTENWKRSKGEITFLMSLLNQFLDQTISKIKENSFRVRFIGDLSPFEKKIKDKIGIIQNNSQTNKGVVITLALNYGGRLDIISAINEILIHNKNFKPISESYFKKYTSNKDLPDPDLLIRTGGEMRLSNFLLWDLAYTELMFIPQMWPDFDKLTLKNCIFDYSKRNRKYGGDN